MKIRCGRLGDTLTRIGSPGDIGEETVEVEESLFVQEGKEDCWKYVFINNELRVKDKNTIQTLLSDLTIKKELSLALSEIDKKTTVDKEDTFLFNGNNFYCDTETIMGKFIALPYLPENYSEVWKTADKEDDEINNIYITLDKIGIANLALAYLQFRSERWYAGDAEKKVLKDNAIKNKEVK